MTKYLSEVHRSLEQRTPDQLALDAALTGLGDAKRELHRLEMKKKIPYNVYSKYDQAIKKLYSELLEKGE